MEKPFAEPFKIKMVEQLKTTSRQYREEAIRKAGYNLFNLKSDDVFIDLLTDSGTGAMSDKQWAGMMEGDESYAGSRSFFHMKEVVNELLGYEHLLPTHQGRAAENVLFSVLVKEGNVIPGNSHFDTTKGHIEFRKAHTLDCTIQEAFDPQSDHPFKGNIDIKKLDEALEKHKGNVPFVLVTITCNTGGGHPVSMLNIASVYEVCQTHGVPVFFDIARFAENAYFIKTREKEYENWSIRDIIKKVFSYGEGALMSAKKDAIANIGGFIALKSEEIYRQCSVFSILFEGYLTYGGLAGRDMEAIARGLLEATEFNSLEGRIKQVEYLGKRLEEEGIPVMTPFGGHAIYVDARKFFAHIPSNCFPAQVLGVELYIEAGVRGVEIGTVMADRDPVTRLNRSTGMELLRLAIPRRAYTNNHMEMVVWGLTKVWERRHDLKGIKLIYEAPILRHFSCRFGTCDANQICTLDCHFTPS
ncbi:MAG: tryptophanase [Bacteroidia bacterium]